MIFRWLRGPLSECRVQVATILIILRRTREFKKQPCHPLFLPTTELLNRKEYALSITRDNPESAPPVTRVLMLAATVDHPATVHHLLAAYPHFTTECSPFVASAFIKASGHGHIAILRLLHQTATFHQPDEDWDPTHTYLKAYATAIFSYQHEAIAWLDPHIDPLDWTDYCVSQAARFMFASE